MTQYSKANWIIKKFTHNITKYPSTGSVISKKHVLTVYTDYICDLVHLGEIKVKYVSQVNPSDLKIIKKFCYSLSRKF